MTEKKERIAKVIAAAGICSRRMAEACIAAGRVKVNGEILSTPAFFISPTDKIYVDDKPVGTKQETRLWCYHKPPGLVTTHKDPKGRPTVFEKLPAYLPRVVSVGRLDLNSEGLLLLTTDGSLARKLEHPSTGWKRKYRVRIHGVLTPDIQKKLQKGVTVKGIHYAPCQIETERIQKTNSWLLITLTEGKNREIRKMMDFVHLPVTRLIRTAYGPFQLGNLERGAIREVTKKALKDLL